MDVSLSRYPDVQETALKGYLLLKSVIGPKELGVDPIHRRAFERSARWLAEASECLLLKHHLSSIDPLVMPLRMDECYARILHSVVMADPTERHRALRRLAADYEKLAADAPESAMVHFRLHVIYSELKDEEGLKRELETARSLLVRDPFMAAMPHHWVRSTVLRRLAQPAFKKKR